MSEVAKLNTRCANCGGHSEVVSLIRCGQVTKLCRKCLTTPVPKADPIPQKPKTYTKPIPRQKPKQRVIHLPPKEIQPDQILRNHMKSLGLKFQGKVRHLVAILSGVKQTKPSARFLLDKWIKEGFPSKEQTHETKKSAPRAKRSKTTPDESEEIRMTNYTRTKEYDTYLKSDLWNAIRRFVLLEASYTCKGCGRPADQVHHTSYDTMTMRGRDISKLVALCRECHEHIEFTEDGSKSTLKQANDRLLALLAQHAPCANHQHLR